MNWNPFKIETQPIPSTEPATVAEESNDLTEPSGAMAEVLHQALSRTPATPPEPEHMPELVQPVFKRGEPVEHPHTPQNDAPAGTVTSVTIGGAIRTDHN